MMIVSVFLFLASSLAFSRGVKEYASPDTKNVLVAGLKGPSGLGMARLMEKGISIPGYAVSFETAGSPDIIVSKLLSGEVAAAALPLNVAAKLYKKGAPYLLAAVSGYGSIYIVSSDSSITSLEDLKGKTVYNAGRGATPDFLFRYLASRAGINPDSDLTLSFTAEHTELAQLLIAGKVETAVLPEPFVTMALAKNPRLKVALDLQKEWSVMVKGDAYPITAFVISRDLALNHKFLVTALLSGYRESIDWVGKNPEETGKLSEGLGLGFPAALAAAAIPRLNLAFIPAAQARAGVEKFLSVFLAFDPDSIGGELPDEGFYFPLIE